MTSATDPLPAAGLGAPLEGMLSVACSALSPVLCSGSGAGRAAPGAPDAVPLGETAQPHAPIDSSPLQLAPCAWRAWETGTMFAAGKQRRPSKLAPNALAEMAKGKPPRGEGSDAGFNGCGTACAAQA